jgi:hypothetical protein
MATFVTIRYSQVSIFLEVLPQLDEHELGDVLGVLRVADDPVAERVDLGGLPSHERFERVRVAVADGSHQLAVVRLDGRGRRDHQAEFRGHVARNYGSPGRNV